jgi:tight adherence protein G
LVSGVSGLRESGQIAEYKIVEDCRSKKGFVLIVTCIAMTVLLGFAALGVDVGRMYVIKSELQAFTDAAALSAAMELDGTESGVARARAAASGLASGPHAMKWDLGTKAITDITSNFAQGESAPDSATWSAKPDDASAVHFARVTASASAPLIFMRMFQPARDSLVAASSVAVKSGSAARLVQ